MQISRWAVSVSTALVLGAALLAGCSGLPTAPAASDPNQGVTPAFVRVPAPNSDALGSIPVASLSGSFDVDGAVGATVSVGRFTLEIPPGAFTGHATVSITVPDPTVLLCSLGISPGSANRFAVPVKLIANCAGGAYTNVADLALLWDNVAVHSWQVVPGTSVDAVGSRVSASLGHFSDYGVVEGKAGW